MKRLYNLLSFNSYQYKSSYLGAKKIWIISHIWPPSLKASNSKQCAINVIDRSQLSNLNCKTKQSMFSCHQYCRITFAFLGQASNLDLFSATQPNEFAEPLSFEFHCLSFEGFLLEFWHFCLSFCQIFMFLLEFWIISYK